MLFRSPDQDYAAGHFAENYVASDPDAAVKWAEKLASGSASEAALVSIASGWARRDPAAAAKWAGEMPSDNPVRDRAIDDALSYWALADQKSASSFAQQLPAGKSRDHSVNALSRLLAVNSPALAADLASSIGDTPTRNARVEEIAREWMKTDPPAARGWISNCSLPLQTRKQLIEK